MTHKSIPVGKRFRWQRKLVKYDLLSRLSPDADSHFVDVLKLAALNRRADYSRNIHNFGLFHQYSVAVNFALNADPLRHILELGKGYSTVIMAHALPDDARFYSLDARPTEDYDIAVPLLALGHKVRFLEDFSITAAELHGFYDGKMKETFLGIPAAVLREALPRYLAASRSRYLDVTGCADHAAVVEKCLDALFDGQGIRCLSQVVPEVFSAESKYAAPAAPTILDKLLAEVPEFDAIYFDCGEFSSMVEWMKLKGRIRVGGIATFHDIYFPRSIKNFLVCAALEADPDWQILYRDRTTPQGMLVARRVR